MDNNISSITSLFSGFSKSPIDHIEKLPQSGGDRIYYRIHSQEGTYIATCNDHVAENETFFYFTDTFLKVNTPVPKILAINDDRKIYIQQDLGSSSLLSVLENEGMTERVMSLYKKSLAALAALQIRADKHLDYSRCITSREFGKQAISNDLLYFKYYFLDTLKIPYDKEKLLADFDALSHYLSHARQKHFMFRDFQSRNIMVKDDEIFFIDYQGGMKGAVQYDVASLLWQAKASLDKVHKDSLLDYYMDRIGGELNAHVDRISFVGQYNGFVLVRLLQVLGAYGFRGLFERKAHFLSSIPQAIKNLKSFITEHQAGVAIPEFERIMNRIVEDDIIARFETKKADSSTPLVVKICSFSYLKSGYPKDETGHGGGFVFDCRGILNPGRVEAYKQQTGRDRDVIAYLINNTRMEAFLQSVYQIVDIAVENYLERDFPHLAVSFGCTGGQHRSVYAADALARHLRNKFGVSIELHHIEQQIFENKPSPHNPVS